MRAYDVIIAGGGMMGLAVACGLQELGLRIAIVERQSEPQLDATFSVRVSALNSASEQLLTSLGAWQFIDQNRIAPYNAMNVWLRDSDGQLGFKAGDYGYGQLGSIIENSVIQYALWQKACLSQQITFINDVEFKQVIWGENEVFVSLTNDEVLTSRLLVAADGANSWIRQQANLPITFRDYGHSALVATVKTELVHNNCARQVFCDDQILAFLPLPSANLCSIVWSVAPDDAHHLEKMSPEAFSNQLALTFDNRLGRCELMSERQVIPLTARYAQNFIAQRLVLVGDAAHTIHPLAGLGANLGFMDVKELISQIKRLLSQGKDIGNSTYLRRYERKRKHSAAMMLMAMQGLKSLFASDAGVKRELTALGLNLIDKSSFIKQQLVRQAMGID